VLKIVLITRRRAFGACAFKGGNFLAAVQVLFSVFARLLCAAFCEVTIRVSDAGTISVHAALTRPRSVPLHTNSANSA
jgi:hypothetical protein